MFFVRNVLPQAFKPTANLCPNTCHRSRAGEEEQEEGNEAIDKKYLEAELIAEPVGREELEQIADDGRENGDEGHPTVVNLAFGEEAEGIETQQGSVGEACHIEDNGDERVVMEWPKGDDDQQVEESEGDVNETAYG